MQLDLEEGFDQQYGKFMQGIRFRSVRRKNNSIAERKEQECATGESKGAEHCNNNTNKAI